MSGPRLTVFRRKSAGQAAVEYLVVVALIAVAFLGGERSGLSRVTSALGEHYQRFTWSVSQP